MKSFVLRSLVDTEKRGGTDSVVKRPSLDFVHFKVDESSAAVAELTSEQAGVNIDQGEPFEEINDAIQMSSSTS